MRFYGSIKVVVFIYLLFLSNSMAQVPQCAALAEEIYDIQSSIFQSNFDESEYLLQEMIDTIGEHQCQLEKSTLYVILGSLLCDNGLYERSSQSLRAALKIRETLKDTLKIVSVYNNLAFLEKRKKFPEHGLLYADTALNLLKQITYDSLDFVSSVKVNKAFCFIDLEQYDQAEILLEEVAKEKQFADYISVIQGLGDVAFEKMNFRKALSYYTEVLEIFEMDASVYDISLVNHSIGLSHLALRDTTKAISYFFNSLDTAQVYDFRLLYLDAYFSLIKYVPKVYNISEKKKNDFEERLKKLLPKQIGVDTVLQQLSDLENIEFLDVGSYKEKADIRNQLAKLFQQEGDYQSAYEIQKGIPQLEEELIQRIEEEKELSAKRQTALEMAEVEKHNRMVVTLLIVGVLLMIITSLVLYLNNRKLALQKANQALNIERELRQQLSFEVHDTKTVGVGLRNYIQFIQDGLNPSGKIKEIMDKVYPLSEKLVGQLVSINKAMEPQTGSWFTLMELLFDRLKTDLQVKATINYPSGLYQLLDDETGHRLFTILDVLTDNIKQHAIATELKIRITNADKILSIVVEDNGKGNFQYPQEAGTGLRSVGVRIKELNGTIEVNTQQGTTFRLKIPL